MTEQTHTCPTCGQTTKVRWESLSKGLVGTLEKFARAVATNKRNDIRVREEVGLSKTEYNNFQKLRYFGLVAKVKVAGKKRSGRWLLTRRGAQFLKGKKSIPKKVRVKQNKVDGYSDEKVTIRDIGSYEAKWLKAEDYVGQKERLF